MGLLNTTIHKSNKPNSEMILTDIHSLSKEEMSYIESNIVEISHGIDSFYSLNTVAKKLCNFFDTQDRKTIAGATAEFLLVCILREKQYLQKYCYKNLEERSIKKGFDGVFVREDEVWLAESKSSYTYSSHSNKHKNTLDRAYRGLCDMLQGETKNDPWENAVNHAEIAKSENSLLKRLTKLSENYTNKSFELITDHNVIFASTIFSEKVDSIEMSHEKIEKYTSKYGCKNALVVAVNVEDEGIFTNYLMELTHDG